MTKLAPEARALTESAVVDLYTALESAADPDDFLYRANAILANPKNQLLLPVSLGVPDMLNVKGTRAVDIDNAPAVHEYLGELKLADAADARLWNYLALGTYRTYMEKRWPLRPNESDRDAWKRRVKDRWLLHNGAITRGRLIRHGIARLWWVAYLTYAPCDINGNKINDRYARTREVFRSEDRLNAIFDREVGAFPKVRAAVLDHAADLEDQATDKYIHRIMQYLTLVHGFRDVGALDTDGIKELLDHAALHAVDKKQQPLS